MAPDPMSQVSNVLIHTAIIVSNIIQKMEQ